MKIGKYWRRDLITAIRHTYTLRLVFWIGIAILVRLLLYRQLPIILTQDSGEYLYSAAGSLQNQTLYPATLRDWRMPTYPLFLAVTWFFTRFQSQQIILVQSILGVATMFLGFSIGQILRSALVTEILVVFLGLNPVYLLNEHLLMSEGLFLFAMLAVSMLVLLFMRTQIGLVEGVVLGTIVGFCILTRTNGILVCMVLIGGLWAFNHHPALQRRRRANMNSRLFAFWFAFIISIGIVFSSWTWRNYQEVGQLTPLTANINRNRLIYLVQHDLIDPTLPQFVTTARTSDLRNPFSIYQAVRNLTPETVVAEELAGELLREQISDHPWSYTRSVIEAGFRFGGLRFSHSNPVGSDDEYFWFNSIIADIPFLDQINRAYVFDARRITFTYLSISQDTPLTWLLSWSGKLYFNAIRPILFMLTVFLILWQIIRREQGFQVPNHATMMLFSLAYGLTVMLHAATLADYDRFAVPFDWILVLIIALGLPHTMSKLRLRD